MGKKLFSLEESDWPASSVISAGMGDPTVSPSVRFDIIAYDDLSPENTWTVLGAGSFGRVLAAEYLGLVVAIKEVLPSTEYDVEKYFARECKILQEARHPNIVQYIGLCLAPVRPDADDMATMPGGTGSKPAQRILIISEYMPHGNLRSYMLAPPSTHPMPWSLRLSFATDAARALAYLHARACIHRDLKGENLLVTPNARLKLCDFGFARLTPRNADEMRRMSYCGTNTHMSPEVLKGEAFGVETDVFSLGVVFAELISRQLVDDEEVFQRQMPMFTIDPDEVVSRASPGCPPSFITLILSCLSPTPSLRPTVRQILVGLRSIESEVVAREGYGHVGSVKFAKSTIGRGLVGRKAGSRPGRIPSFGGEVDVAAATTQQHDDSEGAPTIIVKNGKAVEHEPMVEDGPGSELSDASTLRAVPKGVSPYLGGAEYSTSRSSLPTIPSSWLHAGAITEADDPAEVFFDAPTPSTLSSIPSPSELDMDSMPSTPKILHRFTLLKPGWNHLKVLDLHDPSSLANAGVGGSDIDVLKAKKRRPSSSQPGQSQGGDKGGGGVLSAALARCGVCEKRIGLGKPFLSCDDCRIRCHVKCSDLCVSDCPGDGLTFAPPEPAAGDRRHDKEAAKSPPKRSSKQREVLKPLAPPQPTRPAPPIPTAA